MNHFPPEAVPIFAGLGVALCVATVAGRRFAGPNVNARIRAWWVMIALCGVALAGGKLAILLLFGFLSLAALREWLTASPLGPTAYWRIAAAAFVLLPAQYAFLGLGWVSAFLFALPVAALLLGPTLGFGVLLCIYCLSFVPAVLLIPVANPVMLGVFLVLVVQASDVLQFLWGKALGRHRIAPVLSPSKTVEGFLGGVGSAGLLGAAVWWITPFPPLVAGAMAFLITVSGFGSGLVFSAAKRRWGRKDWGWMVAGHGGVLDRVDSLCLSAPIFYFATRLYLER